MKRLIRVVQAGFGNSATIVNMLRIQGFEVEETEDPEKVALASHIILPGVGHWSRGREQLFRSGWADAITEATKRGAQLLGVCLGMQLLGNLSEEGIGHGLGLVEMNIENLGEGGRRTNVGWMRSKALIPGLSQDITGPFYFTHSYGVKQQGRIFEAAVIEDFPEVVAIVNNGNVWGAQFHPERSNAAGARFLVSFIEGKLRH